MNKIVTSAVLLALFAIVGTALVAYTYDRTVSQIAENERQALLRNLHAIIDPSEYDNDIFADTTDVRSSQLLGTAAPVTVYRARKNGKPVAAALSAIAPDGYNGAIKLLVGIYYDGTIAGVRIVSHHETPGLGDRIEIERSDWVTDFAGKSLQDPGPNGWTVRKDGGEFDQFTGATITPRAVVKAVQRALLYFREHRKQIFQAPAQKPSLETPAAGAPGATPQTQP